MRAYVSLGSHGEYAQEQLTIYASGAPTFSEREGGSEVGRWERKRGKEKKLEEERGGKKRRGDREGKRGEE